MLFFNRLAGLFVLDFDALARKLQHQLEPAKLKEVRDEIAQWDLMPDSVQKTIDQMVAVICGEENKFLSRINNKTASEMEVRLHYTNVIFIQSKLFDVIENLKTRKFSCILMLAASTAILSLTLYFRKEISHAMYFINNHNGDNKTVIQNDNGWKLWSQQSSRDIN